MGSEALSAVTIRQCGLYEHITYMVFFRLLVNGDRLCILPIYSDYSFVLINYISI